MYDDQQEASEEFEEVTDFGAGASPGVKEIDHGLAILLSQATMSLLDRSNPQCR